jgi:DnaK suppressor protein
MNARQLDYFRQKLADEINRLVLNETAVKVRVQDHSVVRPDMIDRAVHEEQLSFALRIRERERLYSWKIKDALRRIEEGTYGICEGCGEDIPMARLKARPDTNYCIACKTHMEAQERSSGSSRMGKSNEPVSAFS